MLMDYLKNFKEHLHRIVPMKEQELKYYKQFAEFLQKYEEGSVRLNEQGNAVSSSTQNLSMAHVRLVSGDTKAHLKNKLDYLSTQLVNPFIHIRNWIKSEMMALESLMEAISEKEACSARKQNAIKQLANDRELITKMGAGKFTIKAMFKSKSGKVKQQAIILEKIAQRERDIENWDIIKRVLIIYLADIAIPEFR